MKCSQKQLILTFAFFALMVIKVSAFHVYSHSNDTLEDCTVCDIVLENQHLEFSEVETVTLPIKTNPSISKQNILVKPTSPTSTEEVYVLYGRPPPVTD